MGLKQSIVIKNEYTNNARSKPGSGSRGGTPGKFVMRYMARTDATEVLAPARMNSAQIEPVISQPYDSATFVRYMARANATEVLKKGKDEALDNPDAHGSPLLLKHRFKKREQLAGRAFGSKGLSLSHDELQQSSDEIQDAFDAGHSVQKIVLSFTEDYLRDTGVLNPDFKYKGRGSYRGQIDQLKLRQAVTDGVDSMTKVGKYIDPEWVGTLQVDTGHVHAHLALVDKEFSAHRMASDGADRGKINEREKHMFRKGLHHSLEDMKGLHSFHNQASLERQSVVTFVKDYAYATMSRNTPVQLLMASLPRERSDWRYGTNRESMQRANQIARDIVTNTFDTQPVESGFNQAMQAVRNYADESQSKNMLSDNERDSLVDNGYELLIERSVNGLYNTLKDIDEQLLFVRTPMTDAQSSTDNELYDVIASRFSTESSVRESVVGISDEPSHDDVGYEAMSFTYRVRGYNARKTEHEKQSKDYFDFIQEFETHDMAGMVDDSAHVMRSFYEEELRYHMGLSDKYRKFLSYNHPQERAHVDMLMPQYKALEARFYDVQAAIADTGDVLEDVQDSYKHDLRAYTYECFDKGVATRKEWEGIVSYDAVTGDTDTRFVLPFKPRTGASNLANDYFNQVKSLDVHHIGVDFKSATSVQIDAINTSRFVTSYTRRMERAEWASIYLEETNQSFDPLTEALSDIVAMGDVVEGAVSKGVIDVSVKGDELTPDTLGDMGVRQGYTIPIDYTVDVNEGVRVAIDESFDVDDMRLSDNVRPGIDTGSGGPEF